MVGPEPMSNESGSDLDRTPKQVNRDGGRGNWNKNDEGHDAN